METLCFNFWSLWAIEGYTKKLLVCWYKFETSAETVKNVLFCFDVLWLFLENDSCETSLLGWIPVTTGSGRHPLPDEDLSGSGPHSFPGFLCLNSGMPPERVRSEPELVDSIKRSSLKTAPKMRFFVLLNSWDSLLVTLLSICSDTWVK